MSTKSRYVHSINLNEQEENAIRTLKTKGISIAEIFRQGLALCQKAESKPLKVPAKVVAKAKGIVR